MIYPVLLAALAFWALVALRDRPLKIYVAIYFTCVLLTAVAESLLLRILEVYEWHMWLLPDPRDDLVVTGMLVGFGLDPLLGVLYARYCRRRPLLLALVGAALLFALEWWMVVEGYLIYLRAWHPLVTAAAFFGFFMVVWRIAAGAIRVPLWAHTLGLTLWLHLLSDMLLQGIAGLWTFPVNWSGDPWEENRVISVILHLLIISPLITVVAVAPTRNRALWGAGAALALFLAEGAAWSYGLLDYHGWSVGLSFTRWVVLVNVPVLYAWWMREKGQG